MSKVLMCSALSRHRTVAGQDADPDAVARYEDELRRVLDYYEGVLEKQGWLAGRVSFVLRRLWVGF